MLFDICRKSSNQIDTYACREIGWAVAAEPYNLEELGKNGRKGSGDYYSNFFSNKSKSVES